MQRFDERARCKFVVALSALQAIRKAKMTVLDFSKRAAILIGMVLAPILVWRLFDVVLVTVGAILIGTLLDLGARVFQRLFLPRPLALIVSGLLIVAIFGGAGYLFGKGIASEMQDLLQRLEEARQSITEALEQSPVGKLMITHIRNANVPVAELLAGFFRVSATFLLAILITIFAGVYLAAQPTLYRDGVSKLFPLNLRNQANETIDHLADGIRLWLLGQLLDMLIIGLLSGVAVWLIGLPSPVALGVIAGVSEFVPYLGPIIAAIPAILVAVTLSPAAMLWTAIAYLIIHQAEGHLVMPLIQRKMVYIPPAVMLLSIAAISSLFGLAGTIFAAPITVVLFVLIKKLYVRDSLGEPTKLPGEAPKALWDGQPM
jgi:predicted PurR-regulated permease PerM